MFELGEQGLSQSLQARQFCFGRAADGRRKLLPVRAGAQSGKDGRCRQWMGAEIERRSIEWTAIPTTGQ